MISPVDPMNAKLGAPTIVGAADARSVVLDAIEARLSTLKEGSPPTEDETSFLERVQLELIETLVNEEKGDRTRISTLDLDADCLTVKQAAGREKVTVDAMRQRIRRSPEIAIRSGGRIYVLKSALRCRY